MEPITITLSPSDVAAVLLRSAELGALEDLERELAAANDALDSGDPGRRTSRQEEICDLIHALSGELAHTARRLRLHHSDRFDAGMFPMYLLRHAAQG